MTKGSLRDKIILFAVPVALMAFLQQPFNAADVVVIGRLAGTKAMAAVGSCGVMYSFVVSLGTGMSLGANATIATGIGTGRQGGAVRKAVHTAMLVALGGGVARQVPAKSRRENMGSVVPAPYARYTRPSLFANIREESTCSLKVLNGSSS